MLTGDAVRATVAGAFGTAVGTTIGAAVTRTAVGTTIGAAVRATVGAAVTRTVRTAVRTAIGATVMHTGHAVSAAVSGSFGFRHSATPHHVMAAPDDPAASCGPLLDPPPTLAIKRVRRDSASLARSTVEPCGQSATPGPVILTS